MIPTQKNMRAQAGFTLVELAIVMIIIGLLIAGVLKGQALIQNAQVTATVAQTKAIEATTTTFRDTYNALPGDITTPQPSCIGRTIPCGSAAPTSASRKACASAPCFRAAPSIMARHEQIAAKIDIGAFLPHRDRPGTAPEGRSPGGSVVASRTAGIGASKPLPSAPAESAY
jgi:prepilin-type N-terminal cleavage/methylation domain-containing protein